LLLYVHTIHQAPPTGTFLPIKDLISTRRGGGNEATTFTRYRPILEERQDD